MRIRAVPRIVLTPQKQTQPPLQELDTWEVVVGGGCENVVGLLPCRLEWILTSDCLAERSRSHPRETCIVPSGNGFVVREKDGDGSKPLRVSAFELGLIGKGRLGFRIEPALTGNEPVEVPPGDSRAIAFELEASLDFKVASAELRRDWMPDWLELAVHGNRIGTLMQLAPRFSSLFSGQLATLDIFPVGSEQDKDAAVHLEWEIGDTHAASRLLWKVGFAAVRGAQGEVLNDRLVTIGGNGSQPATVAFKYQLSVARKPPPVEAKGKGTKKQANAASGEAIRAEPRPALEVPRPRLAAFEVLLQKGKLRVQGRFEGFSDSVVLDMVLKPYVLVGTGETAEIEELDNYFKSILQSVLLLHEDSLAHDYQGRELRALCSPLDVEARLSPLDSMAVTSTKNVFQRELLDLKGLPREYVSALEQLSGLKIFAVLKLAPGVTVKAVPFGAIVDYKESEPGLSGGHASFSNGGFVSKVFASGVCTSNTMELSGIAAALKSPLPVVPPSLQEEFEIFVATVCGEAIGQSEGAWMGVAHTIMNRVARKYEKWKDCFTSTDVIRLTGFEAYNKKIFLAAREYMKAPATASFTDRDKLQRLITLVTPIFMRQGDDGAGAVFFYSPKAQRQLAEREAANGNRSRSIVPAFVNQTGDKELVRVTEQVLGSAGKKDDFEFFAFKHPEKFPRLSEEEVARGLETRRTAPRT
ncbi:hypothetical protein [Archangium sp. Cb G35]|uniref:hypothetical protein n=1 Tax=Archangium sp. Cb G35 TaxID=1920190 RepID=UPI0011611A18|nr:hypothetical protein [Archangium sp. Cb G35]